MRLISVGLAGLALLACLGGCGGEDVAEPLLDLEAVPATHWVAVGGNDTGPGTKAQPWATLAKAAASLSPGDVIQVLPGSYKGCYIETSGTQAQPILFRATPGTVTINEANSRTPDGLNIENCSWVTVHGFTVRNMPRAGIRAALASHITIQSCVCQDNQKWGILTGFVDYAIIQNNVCSGSKDEHGIYVGNSGDWPIVRRNTCYNNRACGIHCNADASMGGDGVISRALFDSNVVYNNGVGGGSGINCDGVTDSTIVNNLLYNNHASGISLYRIDGGSGSSRNKVINNTVVQASDGRWALNISNGSVRTTVRNNILLHTLSYRGSIVLDANCRAGFTSDYNLCSGPFSADGDATLRSLSQWQALGYDAHSQIATAAGIFADAPGGNYRPKAGSPALDAGEAAYAPKLDIMRRTRPAGSAVDIGCYEGM